MIAVLFEVIPQQGQMDGYKQLAAELAASLASQTGFISVERFQSLSNPEKLLSLSFWQDEESISDWRNHQGHRQAQQSGKQQLFQYYRLRIAPVIRDYDMHGRVPPSPEDARSGS